MREIIGGALVAIAFGIFGIFMRNLPGEPPTPEPVITKADIIMYDAGVAVLTFDNATLLPCAEKRVRFMHMDTEYSITGPVLVRHQ